MLLAIDIGNSFVKWQTLPDGEVRAAPLQDVLASPMRFFDKRPDAVAIANVAGEAARAKLDAAFAAWQVPVRWIATRAEGYGVRNAYADPAQLGVDRWLALIAARAACAGPCVVASAGTALTVDALTANGDFLGGFIVPGAGLMRAALAQGTAGVAPAPGQVVDFPRNTADAVESGIAHALLGAIEHMTALLERHAGGDVTLLLGGGAATALAPRLNRPHRVVDNLPLQGLRIVAQQEGWL